MKEKPVWIKKAAPFLIKKSLGMKISISDEEILPPSVIQFEKKILDRLTLLFYEDVTINGERRYTCLLCKKSGFTRKGMFRHLFLVHREEVESELVDVVQETFESSRK